MEWVQNPCLSNEMELYTVSASVTFIFPVNFFQIYRSWLLPALHASTCMYGINGANCPRF